jgi:hypothetical protein
MTDDRAAIAKKLKQLLIESSPLIEEFTAVVCPDCVEVCCRQKHGLYRERDVLYLATLGEEVSERDTSLPLEGPCESMGPCGCMLPRWMRPFKCTWYFCEPLLVALNTIPPKKMRQLSTLLQEMSDLYGML